MAFCGREPREDAPFIKLLCELVHSLPLVFFLILLGYPKQAPRLSGDHFAKISRQFGDSLATIWRPFGNNLAITWFDNLNWGANSL